MSKRALIPTSTIPVIGMPVGLDLAKAILEAKSVSVVTAFAHQSGWRRIRALLLRSDCQITLVAGLDFCHTEPAVLRDWIGRELTARQARAAVYSKPGTTFHPKVFLVEGGKEGFALIGSGNLSAGGLSNNVECFAYVGKKAAVEKVREWVAALLLDRKHCVTLNKEVVERYATRHRKSAKAKKWVETLATTAINDIRRKHETGVDRWAKAISGAKKFFKSARFRRSYEERRWGAKRIRGLLHIPRFTFNRSEWSDFYAIGELGKLVPIYKPYLFERRRAELRLALKQLVSERTPLAKRVDKATGIWGIGINLVSKVLATTHPGRYPVWNKPVKAALVSFGYVVPRGGSIGTKYAAYVDAMEDFRRRTGAPDMLALDCYLFDVGHELISKT